jgi:hypothetical protein
MRRAVAAAVVALASLLAAGAVHLARPAAGVSSQSAAPRTLVIARELSALCFAYPPLYVATSSRIASASLAPFRPPLLWNPRRISLADGP